MHQYNNQYNNITIEQYSNRIGVTLLELLIAIALLSVIVIAFSSIDLFSRYHVISSDRRAKLQNEVSYVLEHMTKQISKAIGDVNQSPVNVANIGGNPAIRVWIDYNQNGRRDSYPTDRQIAYVYQGSPDYQIRYYLDYIGSPNSYEVLSQKISSFTRSIGDPMENYVYVSITARWNPAQAASPDNPSVTMSNQIKMPSVSTN